MAFHWWADDDPLIVVLGPTPKLINYKNTQSKNTSELSWTFSDKTFWIGTWQVRNVKFSETAHL